MKMVDYQSTKCDIEIQKQAKIIAHLEKTIDDNLFQWECCARGGNRTQNGGCDITAAEKVSSVFQRKPSRSIIFLVC